MAYDPAKGSELTIFSRRSTAELHAELHRGANGLAAADIKRLAGDESSSPIEQKGDICLQRDVCCRNAPTTSRRSSTVGPGLL